MKLNYDTLLSKVACPQATIKSCLKSIPHAACALNGVSNGKVRLSSEIKGERWGGKANIMLLLMRTPKGWTKTILKVCKASQTYHSSSEVSIMNLH